MRRAGSYVAFISYSSRDANVSARLMRIIEEYRVPARFVGTLGADGPVPARLFPVFRDREELSSSSDLGASIRAALANSEFLIVVCSPAAAKSRWVDEEVRFFKELGRADRIIALIADGEPNASSNLAHSDLECFPPSLRFDADADGGMRRSVVEPMAADLRPGRDGWRMATLKILSRLAGLGLDALAERERTRRRVRRISLRVFAVVLVAILTMWVARALPRVEYYESVIERWGLPEGVGRLEESMVEGRAVTHRLEYRGGRLRSYTVVNGSGLALRQRSPMPLFSLVPVRTEYDYGSDGRVARARLLTARGTVAFQQVFIRQPDRDTGEAWLVRPETADGFVLGSADADFAWWLLYEKEGDRPPAEPIEIRVFDSEGLVSSVEYRTASGTPARAPGGFFGIRHVRDAVGLVLQSTELDARMQPARTDSFLLRATWMEYDSDHRLTRRGRGLHFDSHTPAGAWNHTSFDYDDFGNPVAAWSRDFSGRPVPDDKGVVLRSALFDRAGNLGLEQHFDGRGQFASIPGEPCIIRTDYDDRGRRIYFESTTREHQRVKFHSSHEYYDEAGELLGGRGDDLLSEVGGLSVERDGAGRVSAVLLRGSDFERVEGSGRAYRLVLDRDSQQRVVGGSWWDSAGQPALRGEQAWARFHRASRRIDEFGREVERSFFGLDGRPCVAGGGFARAVVQLNANGDPTDESYFGPEGTPIDCAAGYARRIMLYDEFGRLAEVSHMDSKGRPCAVSDGDASIVRWRRDPSGRALDWSLSGPDGRPVNGQGGLCRQRTEWDDERRVVRRHHYQAIGNEARLLAILDERYDQAGRRVEMSASDMQGRPMSLGGADPTVDPSVYRLTYPYGDDGLPLAVQAFDAEGSPVSLDRARRAEPSTISRDETGRKE